MKTILLLILISTLYTEATAQTIQDSLNVKIDSVMAESNLDPAFENFQSDCRANPAAVIILQEKIRRMQAKTASTPVGFSCTGKRSLTNQVALIVIDGNISTLHTFEQIPTELIDSITTLKGAQGAALYGSDGVNGVIVVTTKRYLNYPAYKDVPEPNFKEFTIEMLGYHGIATLNQHLKDLLFLRNTELAFVD